MREHERLTTSCGDGGGALRGAVLALGALALGWALSAAAPPAAAESHQGGAGLTVEDGMILLSLDEAVAVALQRNLSLAVERFVTEESRLEITESRGIYDLNASADLSAFDETSPSASNLAGADVTETNQQDWNFGVDQLLPSGAVVSADWTNRRGETNSLFATLNPSYRVDLDLGFAQPLLRNRGRDATDRGLRIARTNFDISRESFELQVESVILQVEEAYWNLAEAQAQLAVAEESLELARQLHEQNKIRVEVGTLAPLELVQSEAGVAVRQLEIIQARATVGDRADVLRQLLNVERGELWELEIVPTTDPETAFLEVDVDGAIETALAERPELRSKELALEIQEVDARFFRNQRLPSLDLALRYGLNGLGGDITARDFPSFDVLFTAPGDYGDALDQITEADFEGWSVALNFAYPIQNRAGRARSAIADVALERGQAELAELELQIVTAVRRVARLLEASAEGVQSAEVSRRLEEKNYDAEQKRYENGMSTSFQVLQIQEDLSDARSRYVAAVSAYRRALALHYQSIGRLAEASGVEIAEPPAE